MVKRGDDYYTTGGRVLPVTAVGKTPQEAFDRAYAAVDEITFDGSQKNIHVRRDIGKRPTPSNF